MCQPSMKVNREKLLEDRLEALVQHSRALLAILEHGGTPGPLDLELVRRWIGHSERALESTRPAISS